MQWSYASVPPEAAGTVGRDAIQFHSRPDTAIAVAVDPAPPPPDEQSMTAASAASAQATKRKPLHRHRQRPCCEQCMDRLAAVTPNQWLCACGIAAAIIIVPSIVSCFTDCTTAVNNCSECKCCPV